MCVEKERGQRVQQYFYVSGVLSHRFVLQIQLPNQLPVVSRIHHLAANEQLDLSVCGVGFDPGQDAAPHRPDRVVGVRPDVQVVHLTALVGETHDQRDVFPTESSAGRVEERDLLLTHASLLNFRAGTSHGL